MTCLEKELLGQDQTVIGTEAGRGFHLLSVMHYSLLQQSFPKKHYSIDTTISLFLPYMLSTQAFYLA